MATNFVFSLLRALAAVFVAAAARCIGINTLA